MESLIKSPMKILFMISFASVIAIAMFVGDALSGGYVPYASLGGGVLFFIALFLPFMSEYSGLHQGFSKVGDSFLNVVRSKTEEPAQGEVEIIAPSQSPRIDQQPSVQKKPSALPAMAFFVLLGIGLTGFDVVQFYILGDGLVDQSGPISNF